MFAFEFAVLTILSVSTTARYGLSLYETAVVKRQIAQGRERLRQRTEDRLSEEEIVDAEIDAAGWEEKGLWVFYLDIATGASSMTLLPPSTRTDLFAPDFFKLILYLTFFCVLCMFYGMPIHIIRDVALTIRSFYKRIRDFIQYKHATRDMNARYPDATAEEIAREDVCIICRENMTVWQDSTTERAGETARAEGQPIDERQRAKRLPCGHLLHFACLRSWLERQQICPTCRTPVLTNNPGPPNPDQAAGPAVQGVRGALNQPAGGPHVYTLGPLRVVFGARHLHNNALPNPGTAGAMGNHPGPLSNSNSVALNSGGTGIQAQLDQIEQYIAREISCLNLLSDQLQVVRALQAELCRLRIARTSQGNAAPVPNYQVRQIAHLPTRQSVQAYRQVPIGTGQQSFPEGVSIPENWTLHALHRVPESADRGVRSWSNSGVPSQQVQGSSAHPQSVGLTPGLDSSSDSAQAPGTPTGSPPVELQDLGSPAPAHSQNSERVLSSRGGSAGESSTGFPDWGSAAGHGQASGGQTVEESGMSEGSQPKGKGKAVTVEDAIDDAVN
ncbi:MAG: hypothetical protein L6R39_000087 [Caloplaca ligustica]|nr:MAG: hypothetical protein L6R39_000087 [Caloplaca ligustica]